MTKVISIGLNSLYKLSCLYKNQSNFLDLYASCPKDKDLQFLLYLFRICNISLLSGITYMPSGNTSDLSKPSTIYSGVRSGTIDLVAISMLITSERFKVGEFGTPFFQEPNFAFVRKFRRGLKGKLKAETPCFSRFPPSSGF